MSIKRTFRESIFANVSPDNYRGKRYSLEDGKGNVLVDEDDRDIIEEKAAKILELRQAASDKIQGLVPDSEMRNAALRLLTTADIDAIKTKIQAVRTAYQNKKTLVMDANTLEELEQITVE